MAVLGSLTLLQKRLPDDPQCRPLLHTALQGGRRGTSLAQQLLAFSRRQELKPERVDIADLVGGMKELLKRAVGESIQLECQDSRSAPRRPGVPRRPTPRCSREIMCASR